MSINNNNEAGAGKCDIYNCFSFGGVEKKNVNREEKIDDYFYYLNQIDLKHVRP